MKYEDYESKLTSIVSNPDSAPIAVQELLSEIKSDTETIASLQAGIEERDTRIRDLQDTNMKLFIGQTGQVEDDPEEKTADEILDELFGD